MTREIRHSTLRVSPESAESRYGMHEFRPIVANKATIDEGAACNAVMTAAEIEFVAFTKAVDGLFGRDQARQSAEDWIDEVASRDSLPGPASREWRLITVAALARLSIRMTVALQSLDARSRLE